VARPLLRFGMRPLPVKASRNAPPAATRPAHGDALQTFLTEICALKQAPCRTLVYSDLLAMIEQTIPDIDVVPGLVRGIQKHQRANLSTSQPANPFRGHALCETFQPIRAPPFQ